MSSNVAHLAIFTFVVSENKLFILLLRQIWKAWGASWKRELWSYHCFLCPKLFFSRSPSAPVFAYARFFWTSDVTRKASHKQEKMRKWENDLMVSCHKLVSISLWKSTIFSSSCRVILVPRVVWFLKPQGTKLKRNVECIDHPEVSPNEAYHGPFHWSI